MGTPAHISPEQSLITSSDIDTRSDMYSLGVLLCELLTGSPPFSNHGGLRKASRERPGTRQHSRFDYRRLSPDARSDQSSASSSGAKQHRRPRPSLQAA
jgi:serine/threonine protein kinase